MSSPHGFVERLAELSALGTPLATVTLVDVVGSTPQDVGAKMIVTEGGLEFGTVGGGRVEHKAIEVARSMLLDRSAAMRTTQLVEWNLQRDVGMTCGGVVKLLFESYNHADWHVAVFGAGHVAAAVIACLTTLECRIACFDSRPEWLAKISESPKLRKVAVDDLPGQVASLPADAFVLCITMGHRTDRPVLEEIFRQGREFPYLGVIGSAAKRAVLKRELIAAGVSEAHADSFRCPIGLPLGSNLPGEIAISVVAELIQERDAWQSRQASRHTSVASSASQLP